MLPAFCEPPVQAYREHSIVTLPASSRRLPVVPLRPVRRKPATRRSASDVRAHGTGATAGALPRPAPAAGRPSHRFIDLLRSAGARVQRLPRDATTTLDSIYARDASAMTPRGLVLARMGKAARAGEPDAQAATGLPVSGRVEPPGLLEGGDMRCICRRKSASASGRI
jgi:hypothetical protein